MKKILAFSCVCCILLSCTKNNLTNQIKARSLVSNATAPNVVLLKQDCIQYSGSNCTKKVWDCTYLGYPLQWDINANFTYQIWPLEIGEPVGAPIPVTTTSITTITQSTSSPFSTFNIIQYIGTNQCSVALANYNIAVQNYIDTLIAHSGDINYIPPSYPQFNGGDCNLGQPTPVVNTFKLVVYGFDSYCNPIIAVVPLNWIYKGTKISCS